MVLIFPIFYFFSNFLNYSVCLNLYSSVGSGEQRWHSNVPGNRMVLRHAIPTDNGRQRHWRCQGYQSVFAASTRRRGACN